MTERVFPYVGYDYSGIRVTLKSEGFVSESLLQDDSIIVDDAEEEDEVSTPQMIM